MKIIGDFIYKYDWQLFFSAIVCAFAFGFYTIYMSKVHEEERDARADAYLRDHKCVTVSYAGRYAEPVYQCDNGLIMRKQIP